MKTWQSSFTRELRRILTDRRIYLTMLGGPLLYGLLFGGVYSSGRIRHIPIVVVDQDHSALSRDLTGALLGTENLTLAFYADAPDEFYRAAKRDQAYACVVFPEHFQRDVVRGAGARVAVLIDGSNILIGNMTSRTISGTIATYRAGLRSRRLIAEGMSRTAAAGTALPIQPVIRTLYNPTSHYGFFILIGLVLVAIQQVTRMGTSVALNLELETGNAAGSHTGGKTWTVLTAKVAATAVTILPVSLIAIRLPFDLFGSPLRGSWWTLMGLLAIYIVMQIMIGYGIAGLCGSALVSLHILLFASVPLFMLSGFTWPTYAMPFWLRIVSWMIPLTHMLDIVRKIALMGATVSTLWPHIAVLAAWLLIATLWSYRTLEKRRPSTGLHP